MKTLYEASLKNHRNLRVMEWNEGVCDKIDIVLIDKNIESL
jgi:hypothetical protein